MHTLLARYSWLIDSISSCMYLCIILFALQQALSCSITLCKCWQPLRRSAQHRYCLCRMLSVGRCATASCTQQMLLAMSFCMEVWMCRQTCFHKHHMTHTRLRCIFILPASDLKSRSMAHILPSTVCPATGDLCPACQHAALHAHTQTSDASCCNQQISQ